MKDDLLAKFETYGINDASAFQGQAFARNIGLFTEEEQERLAGAKVAIPGLGGVGGLHLVTLVRSGVRRFHLADFDVFEPVNVNRQYGAKVVHFGRPKLEVMTEEALAINPFLEITPFPQGLTTENIDDFLSGVDVVLDGLDFFAFELRRRLFNRARELGIPVITAGPLGFSSALLVFMPDQGLSFDEYFDVYAGQPEEEQYLHFALGLAPKGLHIKYLDKSKVSLREKRGPSSIIACNLCAALASMEAVRIILGRPGVRAVPCFLQFDAYRNRLRRGYLYKGNRWPMQRVKKFLVRHFILDVDSGPRREMPELPAVVPQGQAISAEALNFILEAGIQAPSGDNAQPWKFVCADQEIRLFLDSEADRSFFNCQQVASIISCGTVIENMLIACQGLGVKAKIELYPKTGEENLMAVLSLSPGQRKETGLLPALWQRQTNRRSYSWSSPDASVLQEAAEAVAAVPGARIYFLTGRRELFKLACLVYKADRLRTERKDLHEHLMEMIRFDDRAVYTSRDGLPLKNLEAGLGGEVLLRLTRKWSVMKVMNRLGVGRLIALHTALGCFRSGGAALLTVSGRQREDFLQGGRALQRAWLTFTHLGWAVQPMAALPLFRLRWMLHGKQDFSARHQALLAEAWDGFPQLFSAVDWSREVPLMLIRVGRARPVKVGTMRRRLDELCSNDFHLNKQMVSTQDGNKDEE